MSRAARIIKLGDVVEILSGFAFNAKIFSTCGQLPIARIRDVSRGFSNTYYSGAYDSRFLIDNGDILVGMDGEFNRGRWAGGKALLNQRVCKLTPVSDDGIDTSYLFHFLPQALKAIENSTPFATVKHLSVKSIKAIEILLPPISEQRRIAAVLDQAEVLRGKRREALAQLNELSESIFLGIFSNPDRNHWPIVTVADVAASTKDSIRTGPFGSQLLHEEFVDHGIAVLGIDNAVANEFRWNGRRFVTSEKYQQLRRYTVHPGDVLITIMGTCGRCAIVPDDIPAAINTKHLCCITLDQQKCHPRFLHAYFLRHPIARRYLTKKAKGAIMSGLNMGIIKALPIPLTPTDLQRQFVRRIEAVERLKEAHRAHLAELDALFESLQHRAFRDEL